MEEKVKRTFEEPKVEKVEFDFKTRIAASGGCSELMGGSGDGCDREPA